MPQMPVSYSHNNPYGRGNPYAAAMAAMQDPRLRNTDAVLVVTFVAKAEYNKLKSDLAGRPIYDDVEECQIRSPGSREMKPFPAHEHSHWEDDPYTGDRYSVTYAERFREQYRQFKAGVAQTIGGTPLSECGFVTPAKIAELRAFNIYTVEQLAQIDGQELKNLGPFGRDMKNKAADYIEQSKLVAPIIADAAKQAALEEENRILKEDMALLKRAKREEGALTEFDEMTDEQIRAYIEQRSGQKVLGKVPRKYLIRMAMDQTPKQPERVD